MQAKHQYHVIQSYHIGPKYDLKYLSIYLEYCYKIIIKYFLRLSTVTIGYWCCMIWLFNPSQSIKRPFDFGTLRLRKDEIFRRVANIERTLYLCTYQQRLMITHSMHLFHLVRNRNCFQARFHSKISITHCNGRDKPSLNGTQSRGIRGIMDTQISKNMHISSKLYTFYEICIVYELFKVVLNNVQFLPSLSFEIWL